METVDDVKPSHKAWLFPMRQPTEFSAELLLEPGFCRCVGPWLSLRLSSGVRLLLLLLLLTTPESFVQERLTAHPAVVCYYYNNLTRGLAPISVPLIPICHLLNYLQHRAPQAHLNHLIHLLPEVPP